MITITVNGKPHQLEASATAETLVKKLGLEGKRLAMERNEEIIPRSEYTKTPLQDGDKIEIIHAVGGG
ncbi:sulfur carrier protein ThiS [Galenea microaerophila]